MYLGYIIRALRCVKQTLWLQLNILLQLCVNGNIDLTQDDAASMLLNNCSQVVFLNKVTAASWTANNKILFAFIIDVQQHLVFMKKMKNYVSLPQMHSYVPTFMGAKCVCKYVHFC